MYRKPYDYALNFRSVGNRISWLFMFFLSSILALISNILSYHPIHFPTIPIFGFHQPNGMTSDILDLGFWDD